MAAPEKKSRTSNSAIAGAALKALKATQIQYAAMHYTVKGSPKIISETIIRAPKKNKQIVLAVCLDKSSVHVLDKTGKRVISPKSSTRAMNLMTMIHRGRHWTVTELTFPNNPTC